VAETNGTVVAFLLALREGADYGSPNYGWFAARYPAFLYVDRVVVDPAHRGSGIAAALYEDLFAFGRKIGVTTVTCEFYIEPPNEVSRRFHARFGFREVATQWCYGKRVSLQEATVSRVGPHLPGGAG
jgi:predicted GNAT superfamily acetyltransferase